MQPATSFINLYAGIGDRGTRVVPGQSLGTVGPSGQRGIPSTMPSVGPVFGRAHNRDIPKIIDTYLMNEWADNHQDRVREGMVIFAHSSIDRTPLSRTTIATWGKMNEMLRTEYNTMMQRIEMQNFAAGMHDYSEIYEALKRGGDDYVANLLKREGPGYSNPRMRNKLLTHPSLAYMTRDGIMHMWHFLGVVEKAEMPQSSGIPEKNVNLRNLAVVIDKNVKVKNFWGDYKQVTSGTSCWIVLKRVKVNGKYGPFQLVPYHTTDGRKPGRKARYYEDLAGRPQLGAVIAIGTVYRPPDRNVSADLRLQGIAAIGANERTSHEVTPMLPFFEITLRR